MFCIYGRRLTEINIVSIWECNLGVKKITRCRYRNLISLLHTYIGLITIVNFMENIMSKYVKNYINVRIFSEVIGYSKITLYHQFALSRSTNAYYNLNCYVSF